MAEYSPLAAAAAPMLSGSDSPQMQPEPMVVDSPQTQPEPLVEPLVSDAGASCSDAPWPPSCSDAPLPPVVQPTVQQAPSGPSRTRTAAADHGIRLLKAGSVATLHQKGRRPRQLTFRLADDECTISWRGSLGGTRRLDLSQVVEIVPGDTSFQARLGIGSPVLEAAPSATALRTLTLVLLHALPSTPSESPLKPAPGGAGDAATLDLSFDEDETFGMWVAALRGLQQVWPQGRPLAPSQGGPRRPGVHNGMTGLAAALFGRS